MRKNKCLENILTKEILEKRYIEEKKTLIEIANEFNCGYTVIRKYLNRYNIPKNRRKYITNLTGQKIGSLTVIRLADNKTNAGKARWICVCDCNKEREFEVTSCHLINRKTQSCGMCNCPKIGERYGKLVVEKILRRKYATTGCTVICRCDCGKTRKGPFSDIKSGNVKTCGRCNLLFEDNPSYLDEWDYEKNKDINTKEIKTCSQIKVWWKCKKHNHSWLATPNNRKRGDGCPKCRSSSGEKKIREILEKYNIKYEQQKSFDKCKYKNKLKFDFYLYDYNLLIEYQGFQHYSIEKNYWGVDKHFLEINKIKDEIKRNFCQNNQIRLLEIPYWEKKNIENILVKELIRKEEK